MYSLSKWTDGRADKWSSILCIHSKYIHREGRNSMLYELLHTVGDTDGHSNRTSLGLFQVLRLSCIYIIFVDDSKNFMMMMMEEETFGNCVV